MYVLFRSKNRGEVKFRGYDFAKNLAPNHKDDFIFVTQKSYVEDTKEILRKFERDFDVLQQTLGE